MITTRTVFVLGAGASHPYGYPTGQGLRKEICDHFADDKVNYSRLCGVREHLLQGIESKAKSFTNTFRLSSTKSIDLFLTRHPEYMEMGKYAITFRILATERASKFREEMDNPELDWYSYLFDRMTDTMFTPEDYSRFSQNDLSFVTFNYDRSLEHFLYESLLNSFGGIDATKTKEQVSALRIIHVFGQVAKLDWQLSGGIEYKRDIKRTVVEKMTDNLRIIYEEGENSELDEAKQLISRAERVFFLGFGYRKENLDILRIPDLVEEKSGIYGTALGLTDREIQDAGVALNLCLGRRSHLETKDCLALLRKHL